MAKEFYMHDKQIEFINTKKPICAVIGQRAAGKSGGLDFRTYQLATEMPGGRFFLGAGTMEQLKNVIIPPMFALLNEHLGLIEGIDYVICRKPPKSFKKGVQTPRSYERVISWSNGSWTELITPKILQSIRGASFDGGCIDEALLWSWKMISQVLLPTFRGNLHRFKHSKLHYSLSLFSSLPRKAEAMWLLSMQKKAEADPETFAFFFFRWKDNILILGEDYGERMKKIMDDIEYMVEIEGKTNIKTGEEYYHQFDYNRHTYIVTSSGYIDRSRIKEYNPNQPLDLAFDFASHFNCALIIQSHMLEVRCIDSAHVYFEQKINILIRNIVNKYQNHNRKHVNLYGEPFGMKQREDNIPLFEQVQEQFIKHGWTCAIWVDKYDKADLHKKRYKEINEILEESIERQFAPFVRINSDTCEDPIIAIQKTKVKPDDYKKDKNMEKHPREYDQAHAPHYSDCLDNYIRQKFGTNNRRGNGGGSAGVS